MSVAQLNLWTLMLWQLPLFNVWVTGWLCVCRVGAGCCTRGRDWTFVFFWLHWRYHCALSHGVKPFSPLLSTNRLLWHAESYQRQSVAISMMLLHLNSKSNNGDIFSCLSSELASSFSRRYCMWFTFHITELCKATLRHPPGNVNHLPPSNIACHGKKTSVDLREDGKMSPLSEQSFLCVLSPSFQPVSPTVAAASGSYVQPFSNQPLLLRGKGRGTHQIPWCHSK